MVLTQVDLDILSKDELKERHLDLLERSGRADDGAEGRACPAQGWFGPSPDQAERHGAVERGQDRGLHIFIDFGQLCSSKPATHVHGNRPAVFMISATRFQAGQHT
jgi:hypothetical protein